MRAKNNDLQDNYLSERQNKNKLLASQLEDKATNPKTERIGECREVEGKTLSYPAGAGTRGLSRGHGNEASVKHTAGTVPPA